MWITYYECEFSWLTLHRMWSSITWNEKHCAFCLNFENNRYANILFPNTDANSAPCSFRIEGLKGIIRSPRSESIDTNCSWLITAPLNHRIFVTFATFQLYYKADGELDKETTRLQVWDGDDEYATSLGIFSGTKRPFSLQSSGSNLFLRLIVDLDALLFNFEGTYVSMTTKGTV